MKAVSTNVTTNFRGRSQINCENFFEKHKFPPKIPLHTLNAVLTSLPKISWSTSGFLEILLFFRKKNGFLSHFFSRHAKCSLSNRRKIFAIHLNFFPTNFRKNFEILFSEILFKVVLERGETQFLSNLQNFFRSLFFHFSLKIQTFINNLKFSRENSLLLNFSGTHWRKFRQTWQQIFAEGPKLYAKNFFAHNKNPPKIPLRTMNAVLTSLPKIFCSKSEFPQRLLLFRKKTVISHIFSRGMQNAVATTWHTFNCTGPSIFTQSKETFLCLLFFFRNKTSEWFLEHVKRSFGNPSEFFRPKAHFFEFKDRIQL